MQSMGFAHKNKRPFKLHSSNSSNKLHTASSNRSSITAPKETNLTQSHFQSGDPSSRLSQRSRNEPHTRISKYSSQRVVCQPNEFSNAKAHFLMSQITTAFEMNKARHKGSQFTLSEYTRTSLLANEAKRPLHNLKKNMTTTNLSSDYALENPREEKETKLAYRRKESLLLAEKIFARIKSLPKRSTEAFLEECMNIYEEGLNSLIGLIERDCREHGVVLRGIWLEYKNLVVKKISTVNEFAQSKDDQASQLSCKLLEKFRRKMAEYKNFYSELQEKNSRLQGEIREIQEQEKKSFEDYKKTFRENVDLKDKIRKIGLQLEEMDVANKSLRLILRASLPEEDSVNLTDQEIREELLRMHVKRRSFRASAFVPPRKKASTPTALVDPGTLTSAKLSDVPLIPIKMILSNKKMTGMDMKTGTYKKEKIL